VLDAGGEFEKNMWCRCSRAPNWRLSVPFFTTTDEALSALDGRALAQEDI